MQSRAEHTRAAAAARLRAGLKRHGIARRPEAIRALVRSNALRFVEGNRVDLFDNGRDGLAAMREAIEGAQGRVHLETYILRADATGRAFLDALARKAEDGVAVRLLYDALGSRGLDPAALAPLRAAGAEVLAFNPLRLFYPRFAPRRRDHRKILVVDGELGFTGGLNIGDEYTELLANGRPGWRDVHVRLRGPVVRDLEAVFLESWFRADGPALPWQTLLGDEPSPCGEARCAVLADGPAYRRRRMRSLVVSALANADERVRLESPYFAPGRSVLDALARASRRGVRVELLLAGRTDHPLLRRAAHAISERLVRAGVELREYHAAMWHGKAAVFDDAWAVVGSSNLDRQSFELSYEVNLVIEGGGIAAELRRAFERDREGSIHLDTDTLASRGLFERAIDRIAAGVHFFY
jgi:cardiolipin synthase